MSTATIEPPKTEVVLPPVGDAPTPQQKDAFLKFIRGGQNSSKEVVTTEKNVVEAPKTEVQKEAPKIDPVKEAPKTEPVKTEPVVQTDAEKNFAALRQKAEAAEKAHLEAQAEIAKFKVEVEELRKKPAAEEFVKEFEKTKAEKAEYQKRLREADLSRDPEFNAQFDGAIQSAMQRMVNIAVAAGVPKEDAVKTVQAWDKPTMAEWLEGTLGPVEKMEFGAEMQQAVSLYSQKQAALAQADQTWQGLQKQREEAAKQQREQYLGGLRGDIEAILKEAAETPLGKEHTEVLTEAKSLLMRAGGLEGERIPNRDLLGMVGKSLLLAKGFERQEKVLQEKTDKIAELEKTLAERDAFIKEQNGATPPIGGALPVKVQDRKAAARAILNPVIN